MKDKNAISKVNSISNDIRNLIVFLFLLVLLIWGPIDPYGIVVRIAYLILLPILLWYAIDYIGRFFTLGKSGNDRLFKTIIGIIAGLLFIGAYLYATADTHLQCTDSECAGDYVIASGPDAGVALILAFFGALATWCVVAKKDLDD